MIQIANKTISRRVYDARSRLATLRDASVSVPAGDIFFLPVRKRFRKVLSVMNNYSIHDLIHLLMRKGNTDSYILGYIQSLVGSTMKYNEDLQQAINKSYNLNNDTK